MGCRWLCCCAVVDGVACQALCIALCGALGYGLCNRIASCCAWRGGTVRCAYGCVLCALYGMGTVTPCLWYRRVRAVVSISFAVTCSQSLLPCRDAHDGIRGYTGMVGWCGMVHSRCTTGSLSTLYRTLTCCQCHGHTVTVYSCYFYWYTRCHWYTFAARRLRDSRLSTPHAHRFASQRFTLAHRQLQLIAVTSMIVVFMN